MATSSATINQTQGGVRVAAIFAAGILLVFAVLQAALAAGAPWGDLVWGGADEGQLGDTLRVASGIAAVILVWMAMVLLTRGGVISKTRAVPTRLLNIATWAIAGFMALNTLGNLASGNTFEQVVAAPLTALVATVAVLLARRGVDPTPR